MCQEQQRAWTCQNMSIFTCESQKIPLIPYEASLKFPWWLRWKRTCLQSRRPGFNPWVGTIPWRRERLPTPVLGFPCVSAGKESAFNAGDPGSIPGLGRSPGEGQGYLFQYSGLGNSMDSVVHGVTKSRTHLSDCHCHFTSLPNIAFS